MMKTLCAGLFMKYHFLNNLSLAGGLFRKKMNEIVRQIIISVLEAGIEYIPPSKCLLPVLGKKHYFFPGMDSVVERGCSFSLGYGLQCCPSQGFIVNGSVIVGQVHNYF